MTGMDITHFLDIIRSKLSKKIDSNDFKDVNDCTRMLVVCRYSNAMTQLHHRIQECEIRYSDKETQ